MSRMIKNLMVVLMAAVMFFTSALTPVRAEDVPEEPVETTMEENLGQDTNDTVSEEVQDVSELSESSEGMTEITEGDEEALNLAEEETADAEVDAPYEEVEIKAVPQANLQVFEETAELTADGDNNDDPIPSDEPKINAGKTVTDANGDGIYELALTINATSKQSTDTKVQKMNVVMVIDVSGSMAFPVSFSQYTYSASTYSNDNYYYSNANINQNTGEASGTRLHYGTYYRWQGIGIFGQWVEAGTGWYSGDARGGTAYSGNVYLAQTRLEATQSAACDVVDELLKLNTNSDQINDMMEITVIKFAGTGQTATIIQDSTDATAIKSAINGLTAYGGTNWEKALTLAKDEADYYKTRDPERMTDPEEKTSVVFLTDGFPTFFGNDQGYPETGPYSDYYAGQETAENIALCYTKSRDAARTIVSNGYDLYNIFAFGSDLIKFNDHTGYEYLCALTNYAYGSGNTDNYSTTTPIIGTNCFNAKSTGELVAAFKSIINHITNNVGFAGVNLTDGVSLGATSTSVAVNGTAKADRMRYTVSDETGKTAYTVKINADGSADFEIYNADGTKTPATASTYTTENVDINGTIIPSKVYSVEVEGYEEPFKIAPATINADTGKVTWNLAGLGILKNGYTYTVAFDVWPNQVAYDICADLNNGIYANIDAALTAYNITDSTERQHIKDAIVHNADGSYSLYTNYEQSIEFYPAESHTDDEGNVTWTYGEKTSQPIKQPDPIPLKGSSLPLRKVWESGLAPSELNELLWKDGVVDGTSNEYQITLNVWKADTPEALNAAIEAGTNPYITKVLGWNQETNKYEFEKSAAVAPGMMVNKAEAKELGYNTDDESKIKVFNNKEYYIIEGGHYYYVTEEGSDLHFELETDIYHPMIVDGTLYNVSFGEGKKVEKMDPMYAVVATNTLKGGLNIDKVVSTTKVTVKDGELDGVTEPEEECEDEFAYIIKLWKEDETGAVSPVYTYDDQFKNDGKTAISGSIGYREMGAKDENDENITLGRNVIVFKDSTNAAAKIEANKRGVNEPVYATLTDDNKTQLILRMPANGEIRIVNLPSGTKYTVEEILDESGVYNYGATESSVLPEGSAAPVITEENTVSGTISGNKANVEKYYNWTDSYFYVYHSADNTVEKIAFTDSRVKGTYEDISEEGEDESVYGYVYRFNIVDEVKDEAEPEGTPSVRDFLYGGYYQDYTGKSANFNAADLNYEENADKKLWADDTGSGKYPYIGKKTDDWDIKEVYRVKGTEMIAKPDTTYYLKEVPNYYLKPYTHFTYYKSNKKINYMWFMSGIDDPNYNGVGFEIAVKDADGTLEPATSVCANLSITNNGGTVKLNAYNVYHQYGMVNQAYLAYYKGKMNTTYVKPDTTLHIRQFWETPDGITEFGITTRTITIDSTGNYKNLVYSDAE